MGTVSSGHDCVVALCLMLTLNVVKAVRMTFIVLNRTLLILICAVQYSGLRECRLTPDV